MLPPAIGELVVAGMVFRTGSFQQHTDFWKLSRYWWAAFFCSLCPSRMVDIAVSTGAKAPGGPLPFVAMITISDGGAESVGWKGFNNAKEACETDRDECKRVI